MSAYPQAQPGNPVISHTISGKVGNMQTKQRPHIAIRDTGELIAAVPYLLGFRPAESVVICVYAGVARTQITACLRADIPPPDLYPSLAEQLKAPVLRANSCGVSVIVICADEARPPDPLPHRQLVDEIAESFGASGVLVHHAHWVPAIEANNAWWCYTDPECHGLIPNPGATELAAVAATMGTVTYESKAEIRATLEPADRDPLAGRADRIAAALKLDQDETHGKRLLEDLIHEAGEGPCAFSEERLVDLAVALSNVRVRDGCLRPEVTSIGHPIEDVWTRLTRAFPAPYRAEPACLLALTAFLRGDGVLAGVAVGVALEANPEHRFANLLRASMDLGLPPHAVADAIAQSFVNPPSRTGATPDDEHPPPSSS